LKHVEYLGPVHVVMHNDMQNGSPVGLELRWLVKHIQVHIVKPLGIANVSGDSSKVAKSGFEASSQFEDRLPGRWHLADRPSRHQVGPYFDIANHVLHCLSNRSMPDIHILIELFVSKSLGELEQTLGRPGVMLQESIQEVKG
jgi:hypothetical protein